MQREPRRSDRRGLTVVEAAVLLAIVLFLLSLFMPVINYARPAARRASCQSNLKQLGTALSMYTSDHGEALPPAGDWPPNLRPHLDPYLKGAPAGALWQCPEVRRQHAVEEPRVSYGYNVRGLAPNGRALSLKRVANSAEVVALVDADGPAARPTPLAGSFPRNVAVYRHERRANVLWLDGHVRSMERETLEARRSGTAPHDIRAYRHWWPALTPKPNSKRERRKRLGRDERSGSG